MAKLVDLDGLAYFYSKIKAMLALKADDNAVVKSVNGTTPDASGNVSVAVSGGGGGGVSTSEANTWTAEQSFGDVVFDGVEKRKYSYFGTKTVKPTTYMSWVFQTNDIITIDMQELIAQAISGHVVQFKILFIGSKAPSLKFTNTVKKFLYINEFSPTKTMLLEGVILPVTEDAPYILISVTSLNDGSGSIS